VRFRFIREHRCRWPVQVMCRVLKVTRSGFYAWLNRKPSARQIRREQLLARIRVAHAEHRELYGSPRVHRALLVDGELVSRNTVAKLMRAANIRAKTRRRYVPRTTDSTHRQPVADNVLGRDFAADSADRKWLADITYVPTAEGWLYLAAVLDCFSRKIVGWSMAEHMQTDLVADRASPARRREAAASQRSRRAVRQRRLSAPAEPARDQREHERPRRLLRQRHDGKLLGHLEVGAGASRALRDAAGGEPIDL
jgi:putative transposase